MIGCIRGTEGGLLLLLQGLAELLLPQAPACSRTPGFEANPRPGGIAGSDGNGTEGFTQKGPPGKKEKRGDNGNPDEAPLVHFDQGVSPFGGDSDDFWREHPPNNGTGLFILGQH